MLHAERVGGSIGCRKCRAGRAVTTLREGNERRAKKLNLCPKCGDLPHRRAKSGCRSCKKPFAPDVVEHVPPTAGSGLGRC